MNQIIIWFAQVNCLYKSQGPISLATEAKKNFVHRISSLKASLLLIIERQNFFLIAN